MCKNYNKKDCFSINSIIHYKGKGFNKFSLEDTHIATVSVNVEAYLETEVKIRWALGPMARKNCLRALKTNSKRARRARKFWGDSDTVVVATPSHDFIPDNCFGQPKVASRLNVIYTNPYNSPFHKNESKFGGAEWVGGELSKLSVEGGWWNPMILF